VNRRKGEEGEESEQRDRGRDLRKEFLGRQDGCLGLKTEKDQEDRKRVEIVKNEGLTRR